MIRGLGFRELSINRLGGKVKDTSLGFKVWRLELWVRGLCNKHSRFKRYGFRVLGSRFRV
jgi:hypothetical protein